MSIRVEVFDKTIPLIEEIMKLSYTVALESLSASGSYIRESARQSLDSKQHHWFQTISGGKRKIFKDLGNLRQLGLRLNYETGGAGNPKSMSNLINSYLDKKALTVVIGGKHPTFRPDIYRDGKYKGKYTKKIDGVGKDAFAILHKLNTGERNSDHTWSGSRKSMKGFENAQYKGYNFMEEGANASKGLVLESMTKRYNKILHKATSRVNVQVVKRNIS
ncbi:hypothetical protein TPMD03_63 [Thiohalocapsa phage LS06-2018-MD03]|nr:hypothetical protein TPMD03_63 [Thiohalocapsa phage LS06-2018-MD03]